MWFKHNPLGAQLSFSLREIQRDEQQFLMEEHLQNWWSAHMLFVFLLWFAQEKCGFCGLCSGFVEDKRLGEQAVCWRAVLPFKGTLTGCRNEFMWISWGSVKANVKSSLWDIMTPFVSCVTALTRSQHVPLQHRRPAGCISKECSQWCERSD